MQAVKILVWCPLVNPGGGIRLLNELVKAIARQPGIGLVRLAVPAECYSLFSETMGHSVEVVKISSIDNPKKNNKLFRVTSRVRQKFLRIKWCFWQSTIKQADTKKSLNKEMLTTLIEDIDVIYAFWPHRQHFPDVCKPIVCTFQDAIFFDFPEILGGKETQAEWHRAKEWLDTSACVIVSSNSTRNAIERHFGKGKSRKINLIHHAILPDSLFTKMQADRQLSNFPFIDGKRKGYIVIPANIMPHKNHYNLLVAWSQFNNRSEYPLILFGGGTELLELEAPDVPDSIWAARLIGLIRRKGLRHGEDFFALGYLEDEKVLPLISNATALIMPTMAEGGGSYPIEEALTLGVPVLCSDIPVLREHVAGRTAKIEWFDPESPMTILTSINNVLENHEKYKKSALQGMSDNRPTWDDVAADYTEIFSSVNI